MRIEKRMKNADQNVIMREADILRAENALLLRALVDALGAKSFSDLKPSTVQTIKAVLSDRATAPNRKARSGA